MAQVAWAEEGHDDGKLAGDFRLRNDLEEEERDDSSAENTVHPAVEVVHDRECCVWIDEAWKRLVFSDDCSWLLEEPMPIDLQKCLLLANIVHSASFLRLVWKW